MKLVTFGAVILVTIANSFGANILGVIPTPSHSHQVLFWPIWKELSLRGHKVTVITTDPMNNPRLGNLTEIDVHSAYKYFNFNIFELNEEPIWRTFSIYADVLTNMVEHIIKNDEVQRLISDETVHFDVVMVEAFHTAALGFASRFKCPLILMSSLDGSSFAYREIGNPAHPVLHPDFMLPFYNDLTFFQRLTSTWSVFFTRLIQNYLFLPMQQGLIKKYFGEDYPSIQDIFKNYSALLVNTNPLLHPIRPLLPNIIPIGGGIHLRQRNVLPENLQRVLDGASNGVIYFSLGTNVKSKHLSDGTRKEILDTFRELPYTVLWKFENDNMSNVSANLVIAKWFPQQDVLQHPNVKLFITQGGLQSLEEAIFSNTPIVGIPVLADQMANVANAVSKGLGLSLNYRDIGKEDFKSKILEVIHDPRYRNNAKKMAEFLQDQPESGVDRAVWWTEYVIRNGGAPHLKNPGIQLPWYQYYLLDVFGFVLCVSIAVVCTILALCRAAARIRLQLQRYFKIKIT